MVAVGFGPVMLPDDRRRHWIAAGYCGIHSALRQAAVPVGHVI
jgi:hypothetical protein